MSEQDWTSGNRAAYYRLMKECLHQLNGDYPEMGPVQWIVEREAAIVILRRLCADHGSNDWQEDMDLSEIIDRHLGRYLDRRNI